MITWLKNSEIDRQKWDEALSEMKGLKPYPWSWYLDIMSPEWEALVDDDYMSLFPVPSFRKYGFHYIATPVFLQQLGLFSADGDSQRIAVDFMEFIPERFRLTDICIGQKISVPGFTVRERSNYILTLSLTYEELWTGYSSDCRRNINIAHRFPQDIVSDIRPGELTGLFRSNTGRRAVNIRDVNYRRLEQLMEYCLSGSKGRMYGVRSPKGKLLWGMFTIEQDSRITLLFTAGSRKSRELRTAYHVIDHLVRENARSGKIIDFAGSSVPSIAVFVKSFGSVHEPYYRLYRNTLPWPLRVLR